MWASAKQVEDGVRRSSHSDSEFMKTDIRHHSYLDRLPAFGSLGVTHENRVAILNRPKDGIDRAAFLELCAGNRGYHMKAFRECEPAFIWLVSEQSGGEAARDTPA